MAMGIHNTSRRGRGSRRAPMAEINVTPFVDVMLVLLIIFMVTAPLLTAGVPVDLPESRANALPQESEQVTVSILQDGTIYLGEQPLVPGSFAQELEALGAVGDRPEVTLRADRTLDYGLVMGVMGELNRAGFNSISLVTNGSVEAP
ncbi:biopolymer transporter ExbD [Erythrobacteraceae bacterium WH01K]|nr:biopolymer transporter ExbD [Erythrobacteraceae bacterium WH01K]